MRPTFLAFVLPVFVLLAGCGGGDKSTKPVVPDDGLPAGTPAADSPAHLMERFEKAFEFQVGSQYALLLSDDFRYQFSLSADPELVDHYPNWNKVDEVAAMNHLFDGFENSTGQQVPGASAIDLTLTGIQQGQDFDHPDSTAQYQRIVVTTLSADIEVPMPGTDPVLYHIDSRHAFFLVRGDAAVLSAGASADTTHWYVRRWEDLATTIGAGKGPVINPAAAATMGKVKASYR